MRKVVALLAGLCFSSWAFAQEVKPLSVVVMDPLCKRLACACVKGYAQRDYEALGKFLAMKLARPVKVSYTDSLPRAPQGSDVIIGKFSVVKSDAAKCGIAVTPISSLSGKDGKITLTGLFVVRKNDPAKTLTDLKGRTLFFGPADSDEKNKAAVEAVKAAGLALPKKLITYPGCSDAALAILSSKAKPYPAGVISSYAATLIEGCGTVPKGALRVIGQTKPVPFVTAFVTSRVDAQQTQSIQSALQSIKEDPEMLRLMESKDGFVPFVQPLPSH